MADDIRYSRISSILNLLYMMMAEPRGVSLEEIQDEFQVSRRTAERMRDAIINVFYQVDEIETDGKVKRWGFTNFSMSEVVEFTDKEIMTMEVVKHNMKNAVLPEIDSIIDKMKALRKKKRGL